jgi:hypothetical protein
MTGRECRQVYSRPLSPKVQRLKETVPLLTAAAAAAKHLTTALDSLAERVNQDLFIIAKKGNLQRRVRFEGAGRSEA